jgi:MFS family permease
MFQALRHPHLARLFYAALISQAGSKIHKVALLVLVYTATSDPLWLALVLGAQLVTTVGLGPLLGPWADSVDRRRLLVATDLLRALLVPLVPLAAGSLPALLILVMLIEALRAVHDPVAHAVIPELVPERSVDSANGLMLFAERISEVAFVGLAGVMVALVGAAPAFWIDAATYLISGALLLTLPRMAPAPSSGERYWARAKAGVGHLTGNPAIRRTVLTLAAAAMVGSVEAMLGVVFAIEVLKVGSAGFGVMEGSMALGAVLGTLAVPRLIERFPRERLFLIGLFAFGLFEASVGAVPVFAWTVVAFLMGGVTNMLFAVPARSILQVNTPAELRGRVFAAFGALMNGAVLVGTLIGGLLTGPVGAPALFVAAGVVVMAVSVISYLSQVRPAARPVVAAGASAESAG